MKNIIRWYRRRRLHKRIRITIKILKGLDHYMVKAGYSRQQRRQIWRDIAKSREEVIRYFKKTLLIWLIAFLLLSGVAHAGSTAYWKVIMAEAVSEGYQGMYAVACVIRNRRGGLNGFMGAKRPDLDSFIKSQGPRFIRMAKKIQEEVFEGDGPDITKGATHFENIRSFGMPYWAKDMIITCKVGRHTFFRARK